MRNLVLIAVLGAVLLAVNAVFVVSEGQVGVLFQLGRIVRSDIPPGIHYKLPLVQDARVFDRRILTLDAQPERYLTSEKKDVNVDFFAKWRIADVGRFYTTTNGQELETIQRLSPILKEALRNQVTQRTLRETVSDARSSMTEALVKNSNEAAKTLGIEIVDVRIKRIDLPEEVSESVYNRMRAERARVANELRSRGTEAADAIRANADRNRRVILAEAEREAQRLRGEGDAQAAQIYAQAYGRDAEFYNFHRSLEAYRSAFAAGDGVLVLDPDSEFFRYFEDAGRGE
jgi:modulator of FtsH protease HflC